MLPVRYITLLGIKHVGKSSISRELARRYRAVGTAATLIDTDRRIVEIARSEGAALRSSKQPAIRQLYHKLGPAAFQKLETMALREITEQSQSGEPGAGASIVIIATGGGVADNPEALNELEHLRPLLYLWNDPSVLYRRIAKRGKPAFLTTDDPEREFMTIAEGRDREYRRIADLVLDISDVSIHDAAQIIHEQTR